jgi:hypothetical protein
MWHEQKKAYAVRRERLEMSALAWLSTSPDDDVRDCTYLIVPHTVLGTVPTRYLIYLYTWTSVK